MPEFVKWDGVFLVSWYFAFYGFGAEGMGVFMVDGVTDDCEQVRSLRRAMEDHAQLSG